MLSALPANEKPFELILSPRARAWVENYQPQPLSSFERMASHMPGRRRPPRPATLAEDRPVLEMIAEQCDRQKVRFPNRVFVVDTYIPNAAYIPHTHSFMVTSNIVEIMPPYQLRAVIGHEVGHGKQGPWLIVAALTVGTLCAIAAASACSWAVNHFSVPKEDTSAGKWKQRIGNFFGYHWVNVLAEFYAVVMGTSIMQRFFESDADRRGALYTSPRDMAGALETLGRRSEQIREEEKSGKLPSRQTQRILAKIFNPIPNHPSITSRVEALRQQERESILANRF